jgi:hypothetical protein
MYSISLPDSWDAKKLKKCWENLKTRAKKVLAKENLAAKLTGGGISTSTAEEQSSAIASVIPAQIDSLENPFDDGDCLVTHDCELTTTRVSGILS